MVDREAGARRAFARSLAAVSDLLDWADRFFEAAGIPADHRFGIQLGLEELFTNLVKYGAGAHPIEIELVRRDSLLLASLTDQDVEPFDPTAAPDADTTLPLDARKPGGLGLHLVRRVVDRVDYTYENRCSRTTLVKRLG
ncbi:MAG TPA: ATP-binding protein [Candidatus Polarisedimenticolaceae bacterium]|nr:ATP-binding protein [Candidatus Polarisedimenticolaceae bacterium]